MTFHTLLLAAGFSLFVALIVVVGALALTFAAVSKQRYPTHKTGGVVVTGASSGIGRHLSFTLAQKGYRVYAGVRSEDDAASLRAECGMDYRDNLVPVLLDVTKTDTIDNVVRLVSAELSSLCLPLVGVVNNAGVFYTAPLEFIDLDRTREVFEVNVLGVVAVSQRFLPLLRAHQGRVVNMGSIAGVMAPAFYSAYSGSKYALEAISDCMRLELAPWRLSVSLLQPGFIQTRLYESREPVGQANEGQAQLYDAQMSFDMHKRAQSIATSCSPCKVTALVLHALASPYPHTRYLAGTYNKRPIALIRALAYLPDRIQDMLKLAPEVRRRLSVPTPLHMHMEQPQSVGKPVLASTGPDAAGPTDLSTRTLGHRSKLIGAKIAR